MIKKDKKYKKDAVPLYNYNYDFLTHWGTMTQTRTYDTFVLFEPHNKPLMRIFHYLSRQEIIFARGITRQIYSVENKAYGQVIHPKHDST